LNEGALARLSQGSDRDAEAGNPAKVSSIERGDGKDPARAFARALLKGIEP
jgi:hypothetical protein